MSADKSHEIATRAARRLVVEARDAGLLWSDIAISCETVIAIVVSAVVRMEPSADPKRFATELVDTITERAHSRTMEHLR